MILFKHIMKSKEIKNIFTKIVKQTIAITGNNCEGFKTELVNQINIEYNLIIDKLKENPNCKKTLQLKLDFDIIIQNMLEAKTGHTINKDISCNKTINSNELPTMVNALKDAINDII